MDTGVVAGEASSRVRVLPDILANQIAAGEVVERAASVVKELVENAIDAGARRIDVEIEAGGRRMIRVVDDGGGMTPAEARLSLARHATSKIAAADDLWSLSTFGFRGEALPSIAAVSRMTLSTRREGHASGVRLQVDGGTLTGEREVGIPVGTQIEVCELFYNTPARQKFQKTETTESANVSEALLRLALAHPGLHVRLRANGRVALDLPPHRDQAERVRTALARRGAGMLHEAVGSEGGCQVHAFLGPPEDASTTSRSTFLFVGRRFVRDRSLLQALSMGYGELLDRGRYPLAVLFLEVASDEVDVNVHPQKLEVRFSRPQQVYAAVRHVVAAALSRAPWLTPAGGEDVRGRLPWQNADRAQHRKVEHIVASPGGTASLRGGGVWPAEGLASRAGEALPSAVEPAPGYHAGLQYMGQLDRTHLVCAHNGDLVLIDQHAAHERVAFERLRRAYGARTLVSQRLLFRVPVALDPGLAPGARAAAAPGGRLAELGFAADLEGEATLQIRAVPELAAAADPKPLVLAVLAVLSGEAAAGQGDAGAALPSQALDRVFQAMACHIAARAGDALDSAHVQALLRQLDGVDLHSHLPHGRPVLVQIDAGEILRRFGRT